VSCDSVCFFVRTIKPKRLKITKLGTWIVHGGAEMQDRKMRDQETATGAENAGLENEGLENAGPENEGPRRIWKMKDHNISERVL